LSFFWFLSRRFLQFDGLSEIAMFYLASNINLKITGTKDKKRGLLEYLSNPRFIN